MKIVFIAPFGIRPKGTVPARMVPLAAELQNLGHKVVIVAPPYTNPEESGKTVTVRGVTIHNIVLGPKNKFLATPILAWRLFRAALAEKPDLIHLFKPKGYGGLAAMLLLSLKRSGMKFPPLLVDTDDWEGKGGMNEILPYSQVEKRFFAFQEMWLLANADGVTVASRGLEALVSGVIASPEKVLYLPNGAEEKPPRAGKPVRERLGIPADAPVVLLYTRFFEFGQERLHALFAEIFRQLPMVLFLVVGKGRRGEEAMLGKAATEAGFAQAMIMAGWIDPGEIPGYLAAGDMAVYPFDDTLVNRMKCPAKLGEIVTAGVPVIADRVGQLPEYLAATPAQLCEPGNWREMADKAVELLRDPLKRRDVGNAQKRYLIDTFGWPVLASGLNNFIGLFRRDA